ncbi:MULTISPECIES: peptidase inhibitor family I36 protein [unclassified Streptomyces]|uniref:peptidase inhibitor family I36 protein n=1 Tax=unclassified Streptomyces TaxID=2593676 RepID=UPI000997ED09|nr:MULTISPECIES: peptidase inhibitor family I36 protein [unclassified Streptomyces]MYX37621.1 hypothetical protein [Streptomyces sp. SID8377]
MSLLKKSLMTAALAGALLGGTFATPAAAADPNTCPKGKVCGWSGLNRTGTRTVYTEVPGCDTWSLTPARSVSNQSSYRIVFWHVTAGCGAGTKLLTLDPGHYSDNVGGTVTGTQAFVI